jgi:hypothetical protein
MQINLSEIFKGKSVTIVGGGSSLKSFDFNRLKHPMIAINDAFRYADADMLIFMDKNFYRKNKKDILKFKGYRVSRFNEPGIISMGLTTTPVDMLIRKSNNSGIASILVALVLGAIKIYLLGYDGGYVNGHTHFFTDKHSIEEEVYLRSNKYFDYLRKFPIINVGLDSKIDAFRKVDINDDFYKY